MSSTYDKPFLTVEKQVERLVERGMQISDPGACGRALRAIGYYRLSGYWYPFRAKADGYEQTRPSDFVDKTTFDEVLDHYYFDERLRLEILRAIARIEVSLRFWVGHKLGERGPFAHIDPASLDPAWSRKRKHTCAHPNCSDSCTWQQSDRDAWVRKQRKVESISNEAFVAHIYNNYGEPLPVWAATETMTFETLNRLYSAMLTQDREQIAVELDLIRHDGNGDPRTLSNWLEHLRQTRNYCAHHARLWNRNHTVPLAVPDSAGELNHLVAPVKNNLEPKPVSRASSRIYGTLTIISYLLARIDNSNEARNRLRRTILDFAGSNSERMRAMGFPPGWESLEIWSEEYARNPDSREHARLLRNVELLYAKDASERLSSKHTETERRALLNYYRKHHAVLSVPGVTAHRYPAFQFDHHSGDLRALAVIANRRLLSGGATEETRWLALQWWQSRIQIQGQDAFLHQALVDGTLTREVLDKLLPSRGDE